MPVMEISVVPIGTASSSISKYVAQSEEPLQKAGQLRSVVTAMGTLVEGASTRELLDVALKMHHRALTAGAKRVLTHITIDERIDKKVSIVSKVNSVMKKMNSAK